MAVVNVKVANIRPQFQNLKDWMSKPDNVYIGRKGVIFIDGKRFPKQDSEFANPYKIGKNGSREEVLIKYRARLINMIQNQPQFANKLRSLKGKNLGCWCKPESCHGDILFQFANTL